MAERTKVRFPVGGTEVVALHYAGSNGVCVVMAPGGGVLKEPGTDRFAARFQAAGFGVLAIDFRGFGESGGAARDVIKPRGQRADLRAAVGFAAGLPGVERVAVWGFSLGGGLALAVASRDRRVDAVIAQTPFVSGLASSPNALRHETIGVVLGFPFLALRDVGRACVGRDPLVVPLAAPRGSTAMLTTPDAQDGDRALNPGNRYPEWKQVVAARSVMRLGAYRPGRRARRIACPALVVVANDDCCVLAKPGVRVAGRIPQGELVRVEGGHYAPFLDAHEQVVAAELEFLHRHLVACQAVRHAEARGHQ